MAKKLTSIGRPGFDGKMEIAPSIVENPYRKGEHEPVVKNVRESSLTTMSARHQIDDAQFRAGEWIRAQYEKMRMGSGAIDPSYEPVDTSGHADPIPDRMLTAGLNIHDARIAVVQEVGMRGWQLIEWICCEGLGITDATIKRYGHATERRVYAVGEGLRDALDALAVHRGFATDKKNLLTKRTA